MARAKKQEQRLRKLVAEQLPGGEEITSVVPGRIALFARETRADAVGGLVLTDQRIFLVWKGWRRNHIRSYKYGSLARDPEPASPTFRAIGGDSWRLSGPSEEEIFAIKAYVRSRVESQVESPYRVYDPTEFEGVAEWDRIEQILAKQGGAFGLAGPRGAGKTWLIQRALSHVRDRNGVGLWFPSPSEYDPVSFLTSLCESLTDEVEDHARHRGMRLLVRPLGFRLMVLGEATLMAVIAGFIAATLTSTTWHWPLLVAGVTWMVTWVGFSWFRRFLIKHSPWTAALRQAQLLRERIRYTLTLKESAQAGGEVGRYGLKANFGKSHERQLAERPLTLASLVYGFRSLAQAVTKAVGDAGLVIGLDELDKLIDAEKMRGLLRDIKAIFDVQYVYFFCSISHEAVAALTLGPIDARTEFNSSFSCVIELKPWSPEKCEQFTLAKAKQLPAGSGERLGVLCGGNPRELVRMIDLATNESVAGTWTGRERERALASVLHAEAGVFRHRVVFGSGAGDRNGSSGTVSAIVWDELDDSRFTEDAFGPLLQSVQRLWSPEWRDSGWDRLHLEQWRRLLVRFITCGVLVQSPDPGDRVLRELQLVVLLAGRSSEVALRRLAMTCRTQGIVLEEGLRAAAGLEDGERGSVRSPRAPVGGSPIGRYVRRGRRWLATG